MNGWQIPRGRYTVALDADPDVVWHGTSAYCGDAGVDDVAERAVRHWYKRGTWAGEPLPDTVDVTVAEIERGVTHRMTVAVEWAPTFTAHERIAAREAT